MLNDAIRSIQYLVVWSVVFLIVLALSVVLPEAWRRKWPFIAAGVVASGVIVWEAANDEERIRAAE